MMSKAKWFAVSKPSTGGIIATSANQIVPPKFRGPTKMLTYVQCVLYSLGFNTTPCSAEGGCLGTRLWFSKCGALVAEVQKFAI